MLQVQLEYEHTTCDLCKHKFSCDIDSEIPEIRRHLPILSSGNRCTDYMCLGCVEVLLEKSPPRNKTWVACPWCRESKAFSPSNLKYHTMLIGLLQKARDPLFDEAIKAESEDVNEIETNLKGNSVEKNTMSIKVEDSAHDGKNSDSNDEIEVYYSKDIKRNKLNHQLAQKKKARHCMVKGEDEDETLKNIRNDMQDSYNIELARYHSIIDQEIPKKKRTRTEPIRLIETQSQKVVGDSQTARMHALQNGTQYERTFSSSRPNNSSLEFSDDEDSSNDENGDFQSSDDKAKPKFDDSSSDIDSSNSEASPRFDGSSSSDDEGMENSRSNGFSSDIQSSDDGDSCGNSEASDDFSDEEQHVQASNMNMKRPSQDYIENFIDEAFAKPKRIRKAPPRFIEEQTLGGYCSPKALDVTSKPVTSAMCSTGGGDSGDDDVSSKEAKLKINAYSKKSEIKPSDAKSTTKHKQEQKISNHDVYSYNHFIRSKQILQGGRACSKCQVVHLRNEYTRKQREFGTKRICRQCQGAGASSSKIK